MLVKPKAVIFDLDGVITSTSQIHFEAWKTIAKELGEEAIEIIPEQLQGLSREDSLELILKIVKKKISIEEKQNLIEKKNKIYLELLQKREIKLYDEIIKFIKKLRKNQILIGLASISRNAKLIIEKLKIENLFDYIVNPEEVLNLKPAPDIFLNATNYFNLKTSECWAIEDSLVGVQSINAANIFAIGIGNLTKELSNINFDLNEEVNLEKIILKYNEYLNESVLELENISKIYPNGIQSIFNFNIKIKRNEFVTFIGPSGCGKTTTLRMIAGLEDITSGNLLINNQISNNIPSKSRNIAMVFQNYALYPHMTVKQNIDFGLKIKKVKKETIEQKINWAANVLDLKNYLNRKPKELSGGQRQRVALGRTIVRNAKIFLMDEPLANLDAKLRQKMRKEIKKLHNKLGVNTIYVTHDQIEAMTMSDRIVVMNDGLIQQIGTPDEIYNNPSNLFVAKFIGDSELNIINFTLSQGCIEKYGIDLKNNVKDLKEKLYDYEQKEILLGIRPEDVQIGEENIIAMTYPYTKIKANIEFIEHLGGKLIVHAITEFGDAISAEQDRHYGGKVGETINLYLNLNRAHFFEKNTGFNITSEKNEETVYALKIIDETRRDYLSNKLILTHKSRVKKSLYQWIKQLFIKRNENEIDENKQKMEELLIKIKNIDEGEKTKYD